MARIRSINPRTLESQRLRACSAEEERMFWRLMPNLDDHGKVEDDPSVLRSHCFPGFDEVTRANVNDWLQALAMKGIIVRYSVDGKHYIQMTNWNIFQKPQHPGPDHIPGPERASTVSAPPDYAKPHEDSRRPHPPVVVGVGVGVGIVIRTRERTREAENVMRVLGKRDLDTATERGGRIGNRSAYMRKCVEGRVFVDGAEVEKLLDQHPDWSAEQIADAVDGQHPDRLAIEPDKSGTIDGRRFLVGTGWLDG